MVLHETVLHDAKAQCVFSCIFIDLFVCDIKLLSHTVCSEGHFYSAVVVSFSTKMG